MSLQDWLKNRWLTEHTTNAREISEMFDAVNQNLADSNVKGLSPDGRLTSAYGAALRAATIALLAAGYRATREQFHYRVIQSLAYTIKADSAIIDSLDQFRKKRNFSAYDQIGNISDYEAESMIVLAYELRDLVINWLIETHPDLME